MRFICFLLLSLLSLTYAQECSHWNNCVTCLSQDNGACNWCSANKVCFHDANYTCSSEPIKSADACPAKSVNNAGTHYIEAIAPIYVILTIVAIIVHYLRVHMIEPLIDFHTNRRNMMDFSAFTDPNVERIVSSHVPGSERLIWADVSLKISRWRHLLLPVGSLVVGGLILALLPHFPSAAPYLSPIFFLFPLPIIHLIISGLHQLIKKHHYTHVYLLTTNGATIVYYPALPLPFFSARVYQWPYRFMGDVVPVHVMYKVASIYFASNWNMADSIPLNRNQRDESPFNIKQWKNPRVGFENIVKANEVEELIRQQITQLSPTSRNNTAYML